jgi:hypothetical protein
MKKKTAILLAGLLLLTFKGVAQYTTIYPDIPRIDIHSHPHYINYYPGSGTKTTKSHPSLPTNPDYSTISNYLALHDQLLKNNKIDLSMWVSLGGDKGIDTVTSVSKGRIMTCISDYVPQRGLT